MTPDDVRAAAAPLVDFHERLALLLGKEQAQDHAYDYLKGLMVCPERKSVEPIALLVGTATPLGCRSSSLPPPGPTATCRPRPRPSSRTNWPPRRRLHGRVGRRDRRERLHQEGGVLRRCGPPAQRPARQGGQLPGRRLPDRGGPRRDGPAGPPTVPARALVRADARGTAGPRPTSPRT